ncbi:hypothetical protein AKO1_001345, partial [Acrasis kona]
MHKLITLCALVAVTYAASVELLVAKDLLSNPANGGPSTYHNADKYTISCCSASNAAYLFTAYNVASLAGKTISSATLTVNVLSNNPPQRYTDADNSKNPNVQFFNATDFSETPTTNISEFPDFDKEIATVYLNNQAPSNIDVTSFVKYAVAANKQFFNVGWNPTGGIGASVTVAAREANNRASFLTVVYSDASTTAAPTTSAPATCPPCPCGTVDANLSGDNNASPARDARTASNCPVCKVCPTTATPTTSAPTT